MIFAKILEGLVPYRHCVEKLFSKHFMNCLMNQATKEDRYLHRAAVKALKAIEAAAAKEPKVIPAILGQLLDHHGSYNFDQRTKAKMVETVLQSTDSHQMNQVVKVLHTIFSPAVGDE
jgi:DNA polymerase phi